MPGFDRSGPMGRGSKTGRGMGLCGGGPRVDAGWDNRGFGLGRGGRPWGGGRGRCLGGGFGRGRGFGAGAYWGGYPMGGWPGGAYPSETDALQAEAENLKQRLKDVETRLADMDRDNPIE